MHIDRRGKLAPWKLPRKLKKRWRQQIVANFDKLGTPRRAYRLWYCPGFGWTVETKTKRGKRWHQ